MIHGNTGELYQEIAIAAEQLAGPVFELTTGTLRDRLEETIRRSWQFECGITRHARQELCRLLGQLDVDILRRSKPR